MTNPNVSIVAQGAMGAAIGARLVERGLSVFTSLAGRSSSSVERAQSAGMTAVSEHDCAQADYFLSICPPSDALALAEKMAALISSNIKKPIYVDCNAVSPQTKQVIGNTLMKAGASFIDVGIIGLPPSADNDPVLHASGPAAAKIMVFANFGIKVKLIDGPIGAASALKMSYAGITKGMIALGSMMILAATRAGVAAELKGELERTQASLLQGFARAVPGMFEKAYRFVGEMGEIADFSGEDQSAAQMYRAIGEFYNRIAVDHAAGHFETDALVAFLKKSGAAPG